MEVKEIKFIATKSSGEVSGILNSPDKPESLFVFAHGAGAGMKHPFMSKVSYQLAEKNIATLRFNFPYTEKKKKSPDPAPILIETIHSAVEIASKLYAGIPVFAGGKSMGGRMSSQAASLGKLEGVKGIIFLGFPLHPPGKPSTERAQHLYNVKVPMLFLQGTRDKLAELDLLKPVVKKLGSKSTIHIFEGADHSFQVLKSSGRSDDEVISELIEIISGWSKVQTGIDKLMSPQP